MKAARYHEYGSSTVLHYEDAERPVAGPGQVLLRVAATSFNPVDAAIRAGYLQQAFALRLPHTPGLDVAGTVAVLGDGVNNLSVGEEVVGFLALQRDGAAADYVVAPAEVLTAAPRTIAMTDAASMPAVALSAWQALFEHADLRAGQRVLINGAGGAVGGYAVQLAKQAGAVVIATASPRSSGRVLSYGADQLIDYTSTSVPVAVAQPVDVVLNLAAVPAAELSALLALVRPGGVFVTTVPPGPEAAGGDVRVVSMFVHADAGQLAGLVAKVDAGELHVDVAATRPLTDLRAVHRQSDAGTLPGKVVLTPVM